MPRATFFITAKIFVRELNTVVAIPRTGLALKLPEFLNTPMTHTRMVSTPMLPKSVSCMRVHTFGARDRKEARNSRFEGRQGRIIRTVRGLFSGSDPLQPGVCLTGKAADPFPRATRVCTTQFLGYHLELEGIIVVPKLLPKLSRTKLAFW